MEGNASKTVQEKKMLVGPDQKGLWIIYLIGRVGGRGSLENFGQESAMMRIKFLKNHFKAVRRIDLREYRRRKTYRSLF